MEISSSPNERPGNRETVTLVGHNCHTDIRFVPNESPIVTLYASAARDVCVALSLQDMLRCLYAIPPDELEKVISEHTSPKDVGKLLPIVKAVSTGALKAARSF